MISLIDFYYRNRYISFFDKTSHYLDKILIRYIISIEHDRQIN